MIKSMTRSAALFAAGLLLAGGAWGQQARLDQMSSTNVKYASELFGTQEGREILTDAPGPYIALSPSDNIGANNEAKITYTLNGATFSATAGSANLALREDCAAAGPGVDGMVVTLHSGGAKGDGSVTYSVRAVGGADAIDPMELICFRVPNIQATLTNIAGPPPAAPLMGVSVSVAIEPTASAANPFPSMITGGVPAGDPPMTTKVAPDDMAILEVAEAIDVQLGMGGTAEVAVAKRMEIAAGGMSDPSATSPATAAMGLKVGAVTIGSAQASRADELGLRSLDGKTVYVIDGDTAAATPATGFGPALGGKVMITVSGEFRAGDKVVYGTKAMDPEGGKVEFSEPLAFIADADAKPIVYVPGGAEALTPGTFTATAMYDFNDANNNNAKKIAPSSGTIKYQGVAGAGYAHGVVQSDGSEASYLRVRCAKAPAPAETCTVFADCTSQQAASYFGQLGEINAKATAVFDSNAIAEALGGGWDGGRGACELMSDGMIEVQHMVRTGHGLLINNSVVVGRAVGQTEADQALAALKETVDATCEYLAGMDDSVDAGNGLKCP
jgi:hypothetical protein